MSDKISEEETSHQAKARKLSSFTPVNVYNDCPAVVIEIHQITDVHSHTFLEFYVTQTLTHRMQQV